MSGFGARLRNWFARPPKPAPEPEPELEPEPEPPTPAKIAKRISRMAESLLDNERLTSDLDDPAAKELLEWGLSVGKQIVQGTSDVDDDEEAEQAMYPRLRATRRMLRSVNLWIANQRAGDAEGRDEAFDGILEQASIIYGRPFNALDDEQRARLSQAQAQYAGDPPQMIAHLRDLFERSDDTPDDQERGK